MKVSVQNYTGNGTDGRLITTGFLPVLVIIVRTTSAVWTWRSSVMPANTSFSMVGSTANTDRIKAFTSSGFQLGSHVDVNGSGGGLYHSIAFGADSAVLAVGSYTGNGVDGTNISIGVTPVIAYVQEGSGGLQPGVWRTATQVGDLSFAMNSATGAAANRIQSLGASLFNIGNDARVNTNLSTYYYFAFAASTDQVRHGSYIGNNTDDRDITISPALEPVWLWVKRHASANQRLIACRYSSHSGDVANVISTGESADIVQAFNTNGFQVGTDYTSNGNDGTGDSINTYFWFAIHGETEAVPPISLPPLPVGPGGILPFAEYGHYKTIREAVLVYNNLVLGP